MTNRAQEDVAKDRSGEARLRSKTSMSILPPDLLALAQGSCGIAVAAGQQGSPIVGLAHACTVKADGTVRIILSASANRAFVAAINHGSPVAVTFTATRDHTSFQLKARGARIVASCSDDLPITDRQNAQFRDGLVELGFSPEQAEGYATVDPADLEAFEMVPDKIFSQTPGPGAGREFPQ